MDQFIDKECSLVVLPLVVAVRRPGVSRTYVKPPVADVEDVQYVVMARVKRKVRVNAQTGDCGGAE